MTTPFDRESQKQKQDIAELDLIIVQKLKFVNPASP
jgi:hypothetical protein